MFKQIITLAAVAGLVFAVAPAAQAAGMPYGPLTYDSGDPSTQGGPYTFNVMTGSVSFAADDLTLGYVIRGHSLTYDTGFSTNLSSFTVQTTHLASPGYRSGLLAYAVDGVGAIGIGLKAYDANDARIGSIGHDGSEGTILGDDWFAGSSQVSGDMTTDLDGYATFTDRLVITDTGNNATSTFAYTIAQAGNVWQADVTFDDLIAGGGQIATDCIAAARNPAQEVGYAFYTFLNVATDTHSFDNTSVVPEPASLALLLVGLPFVMRRRRSRDR